MLLKIGIERPADDNTAYGIVIPALCNEKYGAFSTSDNFDSVITDAKDAALTIMEEMAANGDLNLTEIAALNNADFSNNPDYADFSVWDCIEVNPI